MAQITSGSLTIVDVTDGAPGLNNTTVFLYRRAASAPDKPTGNLTYTFSTASITGALEGWVQSINELTGSDPIWMIAAVASSNGETDVIESSEWAGPIKMAQNGQDGLPGAPGTNGLNQATIFIYKRDDSATAPSSTTYTFATGGFTVPSGWSKTIPTEPKGKPCWVTSAIAISAEATAELNWVAPSVLVENGSDGVSPTVTATANGVKIVDADGNETYITNGADGTSYYTFVRYSKNANGSGYVVTPTSETIYIGVYTGTQSSPPAYNDGGWTWSRYVGADGQPGTPGSQGPQGVSVAATRELYYLKTNSTDPAQITDANQIHTTDDVNQWTSVVPTYIGSGKYYTCIETTLSNGNVVWGVPVENKGLTDANVNAANAIEIARGVKQHFFWVATDKSANVPAGAYVAEESEESFYSNPTKGNILTRSDGIWIRNGVDKLATLQGSGLTFLVPTGTYKGQKSVSLNGSGLTFYNIGSSNSAAATLASDGLQIENGSIILGGHGTSGINAGDVALSNKNFTRSINGTSHSDLRFAIGSKFGVASDGTLYATGGVFNNYYTTEETDKAIDDIEIGGRNLVRNTATGRSTYLPSDCSIAYEEGELYYKWEQTTQNWNTIRFNPCFPVEFVKGKQITVSVEVRGFNLPSTATNNWFYINPQCYATQNGEATRNYYKDRPFSSSVLKNNTWVKISYTVEVPVDFSGWQRQATTDPNYMSIVLYNYSGTRVDFRRIKLEVGNKTTSWTPAPEDVTEYTDEAVNNIEVGGNNLLLNSEHFNENTTPYKNSNCTRYSATYGNELYIYCSGAKYIQIDFPELTIGEAYILSFDAIRPGIQTVFVTCGEETTNVGRTNTATIWKRFVYKFTASTSTTNAKIQVNNTDSDGRDDYILAFRQFQLEKGNAATAWNPSPSETKSTHTLTASNTSGTTYANLLSHAREGNVTDWNVTSTSGVRIGDTVRVAYKANDMGTDGTIVYVLGTVTAINSDINLVMTSHGLDTTVIDGGHILTGTIDANKVNINTLNVSSSSGWNGMLNSNIQIGGRNLLVGTRDSIDLATRADQSWFSPEIYKLSSYADNAITDESNVYITISFDYSITDVDTAFVLSASLKTTSSTWNQWMTVAQIPTGNSSGHAVGTMGITSSIRQYAPSNGIILSGSGNANANAKLTVSNFKLEFGNKQTDWSPAPEDTKELHNLNSPYLTTGAPFATILGWCGEGAKSFDIDKTATPTTSVKVGDPVRIKYLANNVGANGTIVYLTGVVTELTASGINIKDVNLESTVVDGGHILTGTIDTNRLNANTIKSQIVQTTDLSADRIKSGTISTSRLPADALKTIRTVERNSSATYAQIKDWASIDPCGWSTIVDLSGVRVGDTCRIAIPVSDMSGVTAYITGTVKEVTSTYLTMTGQSISSTTIDGGMILTGKVAASHIETGDITIGQSQVTNLSTDLNNIRAQYGYTNTAADTATKVVVLPDYVDRQGAIIAVRFRDGNTVNPISLNVNNTGVKVVQTVDPINDLPAATTCNFIRDEYGQWRYLGSDASSFVSKNYASALSSAKQISTYTRSFTKANWDTYGANGRSESWSASSSSGFDNTHISVGDKAYITGQVSDKAGWRAAILGTVTSVSTTAVVMTSIKVLYNSAQTEKYVTKIDESGILISPSGNNASASAPQNSIKIDGNGLNVYKGGVSVASYGDYARVGKENAQRLETKSDGVYIYDGSNVQRGYFGSFARIGNYNGPNVRMDSSGVNINTSADNSVAFYGDTARIGKSDSSRFLINATSLQAYDSSNKKYFEITNGGMSANLITAGKLSSKNGMVYFDLDNNEIACSKLVSPKHWDSTTAAVHPTIVDIGFPSSPSAGSYDAYCNFYDPSYTSNAIGIYPYHGSYSRRYGIVSKARDLRLIALPGTVADQAEVIVGQGGFFVLVGGSNSFQFYVDDNDAAVAVPFKVVGTFTATGTKSRLVETDNYQDRLLYCYETPTPLFGDIGEATLDEDGICYVDIDDIFSETIASKVEYQVFLQKEGPGDCWVADKQPHFFIIRGTPGLKVAWELKAKQKGYETQRLEQYSLNLDEYEKRHEENALIDPDMVE